MPKLLLKKLGAGDKILEKDVKAAVKRLLLSYGAYVFMPVQNGMGAMTVDFLVCYKGQFIAIETKCGKNVPTDRQRICLNNIEKAGGVALLISEHNILDLEHTLINLNKSIG